jgi:hypothetical protein
MKWLCALMLAVAALASTPATTAQTSSPPTPSSSIAAAEPGSPAITSSHEADAASGTCTACGQTCPGGFCNLSLRCVPFLSVCDL